MLNNHLNIKSKFNLLNPNSNNGNKSINFKEVINSKSSHFRLNSQSGSKNIQVNKNFICKKTHSKLTASSANDFEKFETGEWFFAQMRFENFFPLSFKHIYTNSEWINKQINQFEEWPNAPGFQRASYRHLIKIPQTLSAMSNQSFNRACVKRLFTLKPKQSSRMMDDTEKKSSDSLLIHRSITSYGNQMRNPKRTICNNSNFSKNFIFDILINETNQSNGTEPNLQINQKKTWHSTLEEESSNSNSVIVTPFEVLVQGYLWHKLISRSSTSSLYEASRLFISRGNVACKHVKLSKVGISNNFYDNLLHNIVIQNHMIIEEMQILRQVRHQFIVPVYDIIHSGIDYYIMMKLAVNKTICRMCFANYCYIN